MKKIVFLRCVIIFTILLCVFSCFSYAIASDGSSVLISVGPELPPSASRARSAANSLIGALKWIGYAIAVGMIAFVGIKYIMSAADEKASMKGLLVKVVIGALIIVFANMIVNAVISLSGA